jgi:hypothetical protein
MDPLDLRRGGAGAFTIEPEVMAAVRASVIGHDGRPHAYNVHATSSGVHVYCWQCEQRLGGAAYDGPDPVGFVAQLILEHAWPRISWHPEPGDSRADAEALRRRHILKDGRLGYGTLRPDGTTEPGPPVYVGSCAR